MRPRAYSAFSLIVVRTSRNGFRALSSSMMAKSDSIRSHVHTNIDGGEDVTN
jgi:hypothetical protein